MFCLWLKLANLWNWDEIFRHNVTKTLSFSSVTSGTCWSFHYSNFEVPRGPCSSVSFVFTLVYYHHFSESDIFRHGVTKTLVQFLEKLLSGLEQGKNLKFFTRVSFYHYLSIIHQANIKNVLYSLFVGSSRPKLESWISWELTISLNVWCKLWLLDPWRCGWAVSHYTKYVEDITIASV